MPSLRSNVLRVYVRALDVKALDVQHTFGYVRADRLNRRSSSKGAFVPPQQGRTRLARRRSAAFVSLVVAAIVVPVAIAYACNPQAHVSLDKTAYQPGAAITVNGSFFTPNSAVTVSGPGGSVQLTTSSGGGFTNRLVAPSAPGNYTITASKPTGGFAAAAFSVAAPAPAPAPAATPAEPAAAPAAAPAPAAAAAPRSRASRRRPSHAARDNDGRCTSDARALDAGSQHHQRQHGGPSTPRRRAVRRASPARRCSQGRLRPPLRHGRLRARLRPHARSAPAQRPVRQRRTAPAQQAALSDLFSNYQPGRTASLTSQASGAPAGGAGSGLGFGIGLLAFGLFAAVAGLTAAEVRRRRPV